MVLVMHTEENDMVFHIEKTGMLMLVVEIDVGGMTDDVVDKVTCSSDDVQPRQVNLRCAHALAKLHWHDIHVIPDRGKIDQTLFIKKQKGDILLVRVYVDDIIFRYTNKELCKAFEKLMKDKFQMSSMGELTFFLGLKVKQKEDGTFISQDKYVAKILRKFGLTDGKSASTSIDTEKPLLKDPDVKRIFRYLKGKPHLGLWYPKDSPFNLVAYSDCDYDGASPDKKSTTGGCQFLGCRLISWQCKKHTVVATSSNEPEYVAVAS
nr:ribonuclease H-like domain, reverse transcriptase, RNA-dependent DNA polymerase [Tanacetum cinerariifolium]